MHQIGKTLHCKLWIAILWKYFIYGYSKVIYVCMWIQMKCFVSHGLGVDYTLICSSLSVKFHFYKVHWMKFILSKYRKSMGWPRVNLFFLLFQKCKETRRHPTWHFILSNGKYSSFQITCDAFDKKSDFIVLFVCVSMPLGL